MNPVSDRKKILVYGFGPYDGYKKNITEEVIRKLRKRKDLVKVVFPVKFEKKMFLDKIRKSKPDVILGLGQCRAGSKIRIERKAVNKKKVSKKGKTTPIYKNKPARMLATLKIKRDKDSRISYDAGKHVCNFSMYVILNYCREKDIRCAFLHIPYDYDVRKAVKFITNKIKDNAS